MASEVSNSDRLVEAREIIEAFVEQEVDYMTSNYLGDPEKQHNVKRARAWLAASGKQE